MPRTSKGPRYYPSRNGWFANLNGERIRLTTGPRKTTQQEAQERYQAELAARKVEVAGDRNKVWAILNAYIVDLQNRVDNQERAENTFKLHRGVIVQFNEQFSDTLVRDLRPQHVTEWLAAMRKPRRHRTGKHEVRWNDAMAQMARRVLKRAFNWAWSEAGLISCNPLALKGKSRDKPLRSGPSENRLAIEKREHEMLLAQAERRTKKGFLYLIQFLYRTGARPAEMYGVKASEWSETKQAFVIKAGPEARGRYKLARLGRDRTLFVPDDLVPLARKLMAMHPDGPLFRTEGGKPWKNSTLCARFRSIKLAANRAARLSGQAPLRTAISAYSYRHGFVTRWVENNLPLARLCELLNTSPMMIHKHYSHLFEQTETLRQSLNDFDRGTVKESSSSSSPDVGSVS
jgi:integrase